MPTMRCNGARLYYEDRGEGRPVVFLHGAWAGLRYFDAQLGALADEYRTVALDFRGHGRSEVTADGYTLPQYARDVEAFCEALALEDVVLVGWSLGALVTWEYVERFGTDRLAGLVDVDMEAAPGFDDGEGATYDPERLLAIHEAIQRDHLAFVERAFGDLFATPPSEDVRRRLFDEESRCPPLVKSAIVLDATLRDYRETLRGVDVPMLVCAGADETWRTVASVERVAALVPDSRFELFAGSGHCLTVEEPERFTAVLRAFAATL
ncbi:alpha/beta fold hydrolase [Halomarina rubra]|uniref:Alpha/beta fold hydrolase n=1 Tax=Halomarina rubra TaxID=2071873 RepID=A0ABD6APU0_9EURY|nr:alpha/beta hydrolase [Halomarina rubra]